MLIKFVIRNSKELLIRKLNRRLELGVSIQLIGSRQIFDSTELTKILKIQYEIETKLLEIELNQIELIFRFNRIKFIFLVVQYSN